MAEILSPSEALVHPDIFFQCFSGRCGKDLLTVAILS